MSIPTIELVGVGRVGCLSLFLVSGLGGVRVRGGGNQLVWFDCSICQINPIYFSTTGHAPTYSPLIRPFEWVGSHESQSKPGTQMVYPKPCFNHFQKTKFRNYFWLRLLLTNLHLPELVLSKWLVTWFWVDHFTAGF